MLWRVKSGPPLDERAPGLFANGSAERAQRGPERLPDRGARGRTGRRAGEALADLVEREATGSSPGAHLVPLRAVSTPVRPSAVDRVHRRSGPAGAVLVCVDQHPAALALRPLRRHEARLCVAGERRRRRSDANVRVSS